MKLNCFSTKKVFLEVYALELEQTLISSNSIFLELENFEFECISSPRKMNFSSLSLSGVTSLSSLVSNVSSFSSFIEFEFLKPLDLNVV